MLRDAPGEVGVGEEVLTERLRGTDAVSGGEVLQRAAAEDAGVTS
jgi:hypothetical protein